MITKTIKPCASIVTSDGSVDGAVKLEHYNIAANAAYPHAPREDEKVLLCTATWSKDSATDNSQTTDDNIADIDYQYGS